MATDAFLKIDGLDGESTDKAHRNEIGLLSWSWGESLAGANAQTGAGTGKPSIQDFRFSATISKASPQLFISCATGKHYPSATLSVRKTSTTNDFLKVVLTDVVVSSYQIGSNLLETSLYSPLKGTPTTDVPIDLFALSFAKIAYTYAQQTPTGQITPVTTVFNVATSSPG